MKQLLLLTLLLLTLPTVSARKGHEAFNGLITDIYDKPVKKARVYVRSPRHYTMTDSKGRFGLTDVKPDDTLRVVIKKETFVIPVEGRRSMSIKIITGSLPTVSEDEQLVQWGFGYVKRREYTGTSNYISGDELRLCPQQTILGALQGRVPGLHIIRDGSPGGPSEARIRGNRSFYASSMPLLILDNVIVDSFDGVNLNDVDYVEVLKDAGIYGAGGANGAIIVHLK